MPAVHQLPQGQKIRLAGSGLFGIVGPLIGSGGQGAVYFCDMGGRQLALKWYHPHVVVQDVTLRERIKALVEQGPPDRRYLWPIALAEIEGMKEFGYVMPVMSGDRRPLKEIVAAPPRRLELTLDARAMACFEVAESFQKLHARGLCYQDVNFGAFFIDPVRGSILICDADNITVDGKLGGVYGTRKFMAPEVVRHETIPSSKTDFYSMAVLFFYIIFGWHPLDGRREVEIKTLDAAAEYRLYGTQPLFLFDPTDVSNGPVAGYHDWIVCRWRSMPEDVRSAFLRAFTSGLGESGSRIVETEWLNLFARLRDAIALCRSCGFENPLHGTAAMSACAACGRPVPRPTRLALPTHLLAFAPGSEVYGHHVEPGHGVTFSDPVGRVEPHPKDACILGLHNLSASTWSGKLRGGNPLTVAPGKTVRIVDGLDLDFGRRRGLVHEADPLEVGA